MASQWAMDKAHDILRDALPPDCDLTLSDKVRLEEAIAEVLDETYERSFDEGQKDC